MHYLLCKSLLSPQVMSPASTKNHRTFSVQKDQKLQSGQTMFRVKSEEKNGEKKRDMRLIKPKKAPIPKSLTLSKRQKVTKPKLSASMSLVLFCTRLPLFFHFLLSFHILY